MAPHALINQSLPRATVLKDLITLIPVSLSDLSRRLLGGRQFRRVEHPLRARVGTSTDSECSCAAPLQLSQIGNERCPLVGRWSSIEVDPVG
jgi:hypothetical protein